MRWIGMLVGAAIGFAIAAIIMQSSGDWINAGQYGKVGAIFGGIAGRILAELL